MIKKIICIIVLIFCLTACSDSYKDEYNDCLKKIEVLEQHFSSVESIKGYIIKFYPRTPKNIAEQIATEILKASEKYNVPYFIIIAIIEKESSFNPYQVSSAGARGLMQVMPVYWLKKLELESIYDLHDIGIGIDSGTYVISFYLKQNRNNVSKALIRYSGGAKNYVDNVYKYIGKFFLFLHLGDTVKIEESEGGEDVDDVEDAEEIEEEDVDDITESFISHTVKMGESLYSIAKKYTGSSDPNTVNRIAEYNGLEDKDYIRKNMVILIPKGLVKNGN